MLTFRFQNTLIAVACVAGLGIAQVSAQQAGDIDWNRARAIRQRMRQGETLSPADRAYVERAQQLLRARQAPVEPAKPPAGLKPLCDMTAGDAYKGHDGGLYGGGRNEPPQEHLEAALRQAERIEPLDAGGQPSASGRIGFISVGMSNTTQEFSAFVRLANADPAKARQVVLVDGAQGGMDARAWAQPEKLARPEARNPWEVLRERLVQAGLSDRQVQVAWVKQARITPGAIGAFPKHAEEMRGHMVTILNMLCEKYPNLRIAYLSSRTYAGYARTALNPEPYAYESAYVVRGLIQDQIKGVPALNCDAARGAVRAPLLLWGPYLWTDGEQGRSIDGLVWKPEDTAPDGTHPSESGRRKVAKLLLAFVKNDRTARLWFLSDSN